MFASLKVTKRNQHCRSLFRRPGRRLYRVVAAARPLSFPSLERAGVSFCDLYPCPRGVSGQSEESIVISETTQVKV